MVKRQRSVRGLLKRYRADPGALTPAELREAQRLVRKLRPPKSLAEQYEARRLREGERQRVMAGAGQDIGPIPEVADMGRREATCASLKTFCEVYFPQIFYLPWSPDQLDVIATIERAMREGRLFALGMPRGSGKTSIVRCGGMWGILSGTVSFVCLIGGSERLAVRLLFGIKRFILSPQCEPLRRDFPEALYPLWRLQNNARRQIGQHVAGERTDCVWGTTDLVFPTVTEERLPKALRDRDIERGPSASSIISVASLDANFRGQQVVRTDGTVVRPDFVVLDDPQTRESARSYTQTQYRLDLIRGDVLPMAGPGKQLGAILPCTVMYEGDLADQALDQTLHPEWQGKRMKALYAWPRAKRLWETYRTLRADELRRGADRRESTALYVGHREAMDRGAKVAWPERFDHENQLSGLQFLQDEIVRLKMDAFLNEYQNEPSSKTEVDARLLTPAQVAERVNGRPRGEAPIEASILTAFVDLGKELLWWMVCGWGADFTGYVLDYGTEPDQRRANFTAANATRTLRRAHQGAGEDGAVQAGLEAVLGRLLGRSWRRAGGAGLARVDKCLVDSGWKPGIVERVRHKIGGAVMEASRGLGIRAGRQPMTAWRRKPGERHGHNWYYPAVRGTREFRYVGFDSNWWKTFVHERLEAAPGDPGALTLFGREAEAHRLLAEHVAGSETWTLTSGQGREVHEWTQRPERPDNHWFDCLVGCAVAASIAGAQIAGSEAPRVRRRRYTAEDLKRAPRRVG